MPSVTGLTAARMAQIEEAFIIDASLSGDDLILERGDGSTINVGSVRGPQGNPGSGTVQVERGTWTPTWTGVSTGSGSGLHNSGVYQFVGDPDSLDYGMLSMGIQLRFGPTSPTFPSGAAVRASIPSGFTLDGGPTTLTDSTSIGTATFILDGTDSYYGKALKYDADEVEVRAVDYSTGKLLMLNSTVPFTWATTGGNDLILIHIPSTWARRT